MNDELKSKRGSPTSKFTNYGDMKASFKQVGGVAMLQEITSDKGKAPSTVLDKAKLTKKYIRYENEQYTFYTHDEYGEFVGDNEDAFSNVTVIDIQGASKSDYNFEGNLVNNQPISVDSINEIFNIFYIVEDGEEPKIEKQTKELILDDLINLVYYPSAYFNKLSIKRDNKSLLIKTILLFQENFDEIFVVEVAPPSSPLMKSYLVNLSVLINEELKDKEEIENIENLRKKAFEQTDYIGKTFEAVLEEAKDFKDYLRFLLTKGEKLVITPEEKEYALTIRKLVSKKSEINLNNIKSKSLNQKIYYDNINAKGYHLSSVIDHQYYDGNRKSDRFFLHLPDLNDIDFYLEKYHYDLKLGFTHLVRGNGIDLFIVDENYNYSLFNVKPTTLNKWIRKLEGIIPKLNNIIAEEMPFPYNVSKSI